MKSFAIFAMVSLAFLAFVTGCATTTYQKMVSDGGYDDFPLGAGKYQIVARGNSFTSAQRVRAIAFLRAAELTQSLGNKGFYILDDKGNTTHQISISSDSFGSNTFDTKKHEFQIIIEPTNNDDGIDVLTTYTRYRDQLAQQ